jgi:lipopolysaccharide/colanic/teichoic acid biosynthesis glycosyltransferase
MLILYKTFIKPVTDWLIAFTALVVLSPLFLITAIAIKIDSHGPVFFRQMRLGYKGMEFSIYKFRSMTVEHRKAKDNKLYENDPRITKVGRFIRKTSIDELPQLINILKGEMSFIGPRPPVTYFPKKLEEYNEFERRRFEVKPGISGLAQVRCREIHDWDINIPIDVEYVDNFSMKNDISLFLSSLFFFFKTDNIYRKNS